VAIVAGLRENFFFVNGQLKSIWKIFSTKPRLLENIFYLIVIGLIEVPSIHKYA
jgi:hypothetical protein